MWNSIMLIAGCFCLVIVLEESIYYFWNRYVYGPNEERTRKWKNRLKTIRGFLKRKQYDNIQETNNEKSSQM
ncbi:hypothetical protein BABA_19011 [Neobacillus bataviensis LMG 21833]|uniref:Uncharacterized protein n=1 Tax=Neobacillus bataviensis LMG 21833 TaxID=1117379 RepID=K6DCC1_9BACI|nr:hypothetical protein [Neobacillus bataviensis]EKN65713.1 hypothetical protein BABA_19011 [Neobacillus bataviensis LMG 21833]